MVIDIFTATKFLFIYMYEVYIWHRDVFIASMEGYTLGK